MSEQERLEKILDFGPLDVDDKMALTGRLAKLGGSLMAVIDECRVSRRTITTLTARVEALEGRGDNVWMPEQDEIDKLQRRVCSTCGKHPCMCCECCGERSKNCTCQGDPK